MDPPTLALNSVRGKAMKSGGRLRVLDTKESNIVLPEPPTMTFAAMPEVQTALDDHLDIAQEPSLAIRSTYGQYLPWLHYWDPTWAREDIPRIFSADLPAHRAAAWDAYIIFCRPDNALLPLLEQQYMHAVNQLTTQDGKKTRGATPAQRLSEHLMTYYWRGKLALQSPLIEEFFVSLPMMCEGMRLGSWGVPCHTTPTLL